MADVMLKCSYYKDTLLGTEGTEYLQGFSDKMADGVQAAEDPGCYRSRLERY
jgi:hypothetical protein